MKYYTNPSFKSAFALLDIMKLLNENVKVITELNNEIERLKQSKFNNFDSKIFVCLEMDVKLEDKYINYILKYGVPKDGVYDDNLLENC